jgi:hypothetical protein
MDARGPHERLQPERARLLDVLERVLDKGIVCEALATISVGGIDLISVDAHVVVASIETYLKYAEPLRLCLQAAHSDECISHPEGRVLPEAAREHFPDASPELPAPEAAVRAVETYLRQLRQGGQPDCTV